MTPRPAPLAAYDKLRLAHASSSSEAHAAGLYLARVTAEMVAARDRIAEDTDESWNAYYAAWNVYKAAKEAHKAATEAEAKAYRDLEVWTVRVIDEARRPAKSSWETDGEECCCRRRNTQMGDL